MARVLAVSNDYVNRSMAGPAIRCFELSRELVEAGHEVTLATPAPSDVEDAPFPLVAYDADVLRRLAPGHDVIVLQGWVLERFPFLRDSGAAIVVDLYDPFPLELLVTISREPTERRLRERVEALLCLNEQVRLGDFFMCSSEKQRDYWLGALTALNRVNPDSYREDPSLRSLIDVVPFGIQARPPRRTGPAVRGVVEEIGPDDLLLLWGGGVYNWFDPLTLIRGVAEAGPRHPRLRLLFMATSHPNPDVPEMWMLTRARELAADLGLLGSHVFFNEAWVPYRERAGWFLDADVGVSTHFDHVETRFSFRTRVLDYFWAGLPVLCTAGDTLADDVERGRLGLTVPPEDPAAVAAALDVLADAGERRRMAARVRRHARGLSWEQAAAPLVRFCGAPRRAPDLVAAGAAKAPPVPVRDHAPAPIPAARPDRRSGLAEVRRLAGRSGEVLRAGGPGALFSSGARWLRRRLAHRAGDPT
jgi:glycosyltransferase involved in cell wall biosynthesis